MSDLLWATLALATLLILTLIVLGLRSLSLDKTGLGVSNLFEDGLLFGIFAILFAPIYLAWMGGRSIWFRLRPPAGFPTDGDDPVWSRRINRQVVETAFLAVQQARMKHNADLAKRFIGQELYKRLRREFGREKNQRENQSSRQVKLTDIVFAEERIEKHLCYFNATVSGVIHDDSQSLDEAEEFEVQLEFARALPEVHDARWQLMDMSGECLT